MNARFERLRDHIAGSVIGQSRLVERLIVGILAGGHLLLEGVPGLAKTTAVQALAAGTMLRFRRIQFTPDMIPGDITGTDILRAEEGRFEFVPGPVFSDIVLADEINRAPPKVQSALLEAMQERQVTVGGTTRGLPPVFMVIATQNPIEHEGTYPLPEAQLDRFLMKVRIDYPSAEDELAILRLDQARGDDGHITAASAVLDQESLLAARRAVHEVHVDDMLERYIVAVVGATREPARWHADLAAWLNRGASPRATLALAHTARARALLLGRDFVEPDDVLELAADVLGHRIGLSFAARAAGVDAGQAVARILECVPIP